MKAPRGSAPITAEPFELAAIAAEFGGVGEIARNAAIVAANAVPFVLGAAVREGAKRAKRWEVEEYRSRFPGRYVNDEGEDLGPIELPDSTPAPVMAGSKYSRKRSHSASVGRIVSAYRKKKAVNFVKRTLRRWAEMKHVAFVVGTDFTNSGTLSTNGVFQQVSGMAQGNTDLTRVGNQVELAWLMFNFQFTLAANTQTGGAVRIIFFVDHQAQSQPTPATILANAAATGPWTATDVHRTWNLDNVSHGVGPQRIRILYDKVMEVNLLNSSATATNRRTVKGRINLKNMKEFFNGSTATSYVTNAIHCFVIGDTDSLDLTAGQVQTCYFDG